MMRLLFSQPKYVILAGCVVFVMAVLASGWANTYQRLQDQKAINRQQVEYLQRTSTMNQVAIYGLSYALSSEQAKAGNLEASRDDRQKKLNSARSFVGGLRYRIGQLEQQLEQCKNTTKMVSGKGWTSQAEVKIKEDE